MGWVLQRVTGCSDVPCVTCIQLPTTWLCGNTMWKGEIWFIRMIQYTLNDHFGMNQTSQSELCVSCPSTQTTSLYNCIIDKQSANIQTQSSTLSAFLHNNHTSQTILWQEVCPHEVKGQPNAVRSPQRCLSVRRKDEQIVLSSLSPACVYHSLPEQALGSHSSNNWYCFH